jgi:hypothetical protein
MVGILGTYDPRSAKLFIAGVEIKPFADIVITGTISLRPALRKQQYTALWLLGAHGFLGGFARG